MSDTAVPVPAGWTPAFEGQRPPFAPGNTLAVTHGAYSPKIAAPRAEAVVADLLADPDVAYLRAPAYRAAVWRYAQRQARADLLHDRLVEHGAECGGCKQCAAWELRWQTLDAAAGKASERLGLDPLSRARLGKDVASMRLDVATLLTRMREDQEQGSTAHQDQGATDDPDAAL